jgi:hypothetical protein
MVYAPTISASLFNDLYNIWGSKIFEPLHYAIFYCLLSLWLSYEKTVTQCRKFTGFLCDFR